MLHVLYNDCLCSVDDNKRFEWPVTITFESMVKVKYMCILSSCIAPLTFFDGGYSDLTQCLSDVYRWPENIPGMTIDSKVEVKII